MRQIFTPIFFLLLLTTTGKYLVAQTKAFPKGSLFIIGGGNRSDALIKQLVLTAKLGAKDYIVILPMASEIPDTGFKYISKQLRIHTNQPIRNFDFNKHDTKDAKWVDSVAGAKLIYILGGDQNRFMKAVLNTPVYTAIHKAYSTGSTIAGTSAGAAVMSKHMITGVQLKDSKYKETFDKLWDNNIEFSQGLGLLEHTIIDQHFLKRNRYNRVISALAAKPGYMGVGVDESTAIIVKGNKATVAGDSQVLRFISPENARATESGLLKFKQINLGVYTAGDVFDIIP
ncbi:cyanophycinase [uncultured Mucilaginibacter sp.]|uniref:cyanophycinase n=1 Tax=uncultured Mucilaginibacter sp. TaxID=797541 RepID=UPI0025F28096|nr:cyanophycinase [uncultured Mucilaginibacter sp.]